MNHRIVAALGAATLSLGLFAAPALAASGSGNGGNGRVQLTGECSASSTWRLRIRPIVKKDITRVQAKVDSGVAGEAWHVVASDNGTVVLDKTLTTRADGELQGSAKLAGATGHSLEITATNVATGETCSASASV